MNHFNMHTVKFLPFILLAFVACKEESQNPTTARSGAYHQANYFDGLLSARQRRRFHGYANHH